MFSLFSPINNPICAIYSHYIQLVSLPHTLQCAVPILSPLIVFVISLFTRKEKKTKLCLQGAAIIKPLYLQKTILVLTFN